MPFNIGLGIYRFQPFRPTGVSLISITERWLGGLKQAGENLKKYRKKNSVILAEACYAKLLAEAPLFLKALIQCKLITLDETPGGNEIDIPILRILFNIPNVIRDMIF